MTTQTRLFFKGIIHRVKQSRENVELNARDRFCSSETKSDSSGTENGLFQGVCGKNVDFFIYFAFVVFASIENKDWSRYFVQIEIGANESVPRCRRKKSGLLGVLSLHAWLFTFYAQLFLDLTSYNFHRIKINAEIPGNNNYLNSSIRQPCP